MRRNLSRTLPTRSEWLERVEQLGRDAALTAALPGDMDAEDWLEVRMQLAGQFVSLLWPAIADPQFVAASCEATLQSGRPQLASPGKGAPTSRVDAVVEVLAALALGDLALQEEEGGERPALV